MSRSFTNTNLVAQQKALETAGMANSYSSRDEVARNLNFAESNSRFAMGERAR